MFTKIDVYPFWEHRALAFECLPDIPHLSSWKYMGNMKLKSGDSGSVHVSLMKDNCGHALTLYLHVGMSGLSIGVMWLLYMKSSWGQVNPHVADNFLRQSVVVLALVPV